MGLAEIASDSDALLMSYDTTKPAAEAKPKSDCSAARNEANKCEEDQKKAKKEDAAKKAEQETKDKAAAKKD